MLDSLGQYVRKVITCQVKFYHEPETDSLFCYFQDKQSYAQQMTSRFTLFLACEDDSLVGFEVKGISQELDAEDKLLDTIDKLQETVDDFRGRLNAEKEQMKHLIAKLEGEEK